MVNFQYIINYQIVLNQIKYFFIRLYYSVFKPYRIVNIELYQPKLFKAGERIIASNIDNDLLYLGKNKFYLPRTKKYNRKMLQK